MRTLPLLLLVVTAGMVLAVAGLWLVHLNVPLDLRKANNDVGGSYLQAVGTIYAVLLAFVVFEVWSQHNEAWRLIDHEADELSDVVRLARSLGEPVSSRVVKTARDYLIEVVEHEWSLLATGQVSPRAIELLDKLWLALTTLEPQTCREETLFAEAVARFNEFSDARTDLRQVSQLHMPVTLWALLLTGACGTVGSMYLFGLDDFWSLAVMTASLAGAIAFVLFLIWDLDHKFAGDWQVRPEPLRQLLKQLERETVIPASEAAE